MVKSRRTHHDREILIVYNDLETALNGQRFVVGAVARKTDCINRQTGGGRDGCGRGFDVESSSVTIPYRYATS
jgi:hypothetical protein